MRASKLITLSAIAVLMTGGTSLALGQGGAGSIQGGDMQRGAAINKSTSVRSSLGKGPYAQASEGSLRRSEIYGKRGLKLQGSRSLERRQAMLGEHGRIIKGVHNRVISGERGQALNAEPGRTMAGQGLKSAAQTQGQFQSRNAAGLAHSYGSNAEIGLNSQQRNHLSGMLSARRDIPRLSTVDTNIRVGAFVPRNVRMIPVPREVARMHPQFRGDRVFLYRNEAVIVDPSTSRIKAKIPA